MTAKPQIHGNARLEDDGKTLVIKTMAKRGAKLKLNEQRYEVSDAQPDPAVAFPVIALKKADGKVYHVSVTEWGAACDCVSGEIREKYNLGPCKHTLALIAVGLLPK